MVNDYKIHCKIHSSPVLNKRVECWWIRCFTRNISKCSVGCRLPFLVLVQAPSLFDWKMQLKFLPQTHDLIIHIKLYWDISGSCSPVCIIKTATGSGHDTAMYRHAESKRKLSAVPNCCMPLLALDILFHILQRNILFAAHQMLSVHHVSSPLLTQWTGCELHRIDEAVTPFCLWLREIAVNLSQTVTKFTSKVCAFETLGWPTAG